MTRMTHVLAGDYYPYYERPWWEGPAPTVGAISFESRTTLADFTTQQLIDELRRRKQDLRALDDVSLPERKATK